MKASCTSTSLPYKSPSNKLNTFKFTSQRRVCLFETRNICWEWGSRRVLRLQLQRAQYWIVFYLRPQCWSLGPVFSAGNVRRASSSASCDFGLPKTLFLSCWGPACRWFHLTLLTATRLPMDCKVMIKIRICIVCYPRGLFRLREWWSSWWLARQTVNFLLKLSVLSRLWKSKRRATREAPV